MVKNYINIYNNLVNFTRNKKIFIIFTKEDTFGDRLLILLIHFAFFLKNYKNHEDKKTMQELYDYFFRQLELSIREIGYGDATINKKMKNYINVFHSMLNEIEEWNNLNLVEKSALIKKYLNTNEKVDKLSEYFDKYLNFLSKKPFNLFVKSVIKAEF